MFSRLHTVNSGIRYSRFFPALICRYVQRPSVTAAQCTETESACDGACQSWAATTEGESTSSMFRTKPHSIDKSAAGTVTSWWNEMPPQFVPKSVNPSQRDRVAATPNGGRDIAPEGHSSYRVELEEPTAKVGSCYLGSFVCFFCANCFCSFILSCSLA